MTTLEFRFVESVRPTDRTDERAGERIPSAAADTFLILYTEIETDNKKPQ
jgi:hypothetical protein